MQNTKGDSMTFAISSLALLLATLAGFALVSANGDWNAEGY